MRVVGHHQQWRLGRDHGEQFQRGQRDPVQVGQRVFVQTQGRSQEIALFRGQASRQAQDRPQQLMQPGKREAGLGSHPAAGQRPHFASRRQPLRLVEQGRLADARRAVQQQGGTGTGRGLIEQGRQGG